jgi:hypothetical protein
MTSTPRQFLRILVLVGMAACTTSTPQGDASTTDPGTCTVQPDCCSEEACIRLTDTDDVEVCDTDCDRSHLSCTEEPDGTCTLSRN